MPKTSEMRTSKFLQKSDVGLGALLTVKDCIKEDVSMEDQPEDLKWCLTFRETAKPLVLNATNIQLCEKIFGSDDTDQWRGKQIVCYTDPNVSFGGKLIGGIRVRAPRLKQAMGGTLVQVPNQGNRNPVPAPLPAEEPADYDDDSDIAF